MRKFGIEIECEISTAKAVTAINNAEGIVASSRRHGYHDGGYSAWKVEYDSSVRNGCEVVSPILSGDAGREEIRIACKALNDAGASVNRTCGLHVHIDAGDLDVAHLKNIVTRYARNTPAIEEFMPASRRSGSRHAEHYCNSIQNAVNTTWFRQAQTRSAVASSISRMSTVNVSAITRTGTIEFRQHSGTVNAEKIIAWVDFLQAFVEASRPVSVRSTGNRSARRGNGRRLTPKRQALVVGLAHAGSFGLTTEGCAEVSTLTEGSVIATISYLRREGYQVRKRNGRYVLIANPPPVEAPEQSTTTVSTTLAPMWKGVPVSVKNYYKERALDLAS